MGSISSGIAGIGSGIGDLFSASGDRASASAYRKASKIATQNAELEVQSTQIQEAQSSRQVFQTLGAQEADVAGNGLTESGSARALFASSASQGALQKQVLEVQGQINENSYKAAAAAYTGQASAADAAASAATATGIGNIIGGTVGLFGF